MPALRINFASGDYFRDDQADEEAGACAGCESGPGRSRTNLDLMDVAPITFRFLQSFAMHLSDLGVIRGLA